MSNEDILREIYLHDDPAFVAKEIATVLGMSRQGIHDRLGELEEMSYLNSKKPGRDRIYWMTSDGESKARTLFRP